jgi:phosphopentomutase
LASEATEENLRNNFTQEMIRMKRIFLIVLDSFGIGEMPDAADFHDVGANTIASCATSPYFKLPNLQKLGLFNIDGVCVGEKAEAPLAAIARMKEASKGKDTTIGHWEIAGVKSMRPLPTYPNGFPKEVLDAFCEKTGRGVLCNRPYSGTEVIKDYGKEHMETGKLIVYTSADSVFQIAAHEEIVPVEQLYEYCHIAREILKGEHGVGRVIARPFVGEEGSFTRTPRRHDYSLLPPKDTMLNQIEKAGREVLGVGKIYDIFAGSGITEYTYSTGNADGIEKTLSYMDKDFSGLCFVNLVDFDMLYGHRNDIDGYAKALAYFDEKLPLIMGKLQDEDVLMITADHGCDPGYTVSTDHSREYTPFLMYGKNIAPVNYGTRDTFADIAATILKLLDVPGETDGNSLL